MDTDGGPPVPRWAVDEDVFDFRLDSGGDVALQEPLHLGLAAVGDVGVAAALDRPELVDPRVVTREGELEVVGERGHCRPVVAGVEHGDVAPNIQRTVALYMPHFVV